MLNSHTEVWAIHLSCPRKDIYNKFYKSEVEVRPCLAYLPSLSFWWCWPIVVANCTSCHFCWGLGSGLWCTCTCTVSNVNVNVSNSISRTSELKELNKESVKAFVSWTLYPVCWKVTIWLQDQACKVKFVKFVKWYHISYLFETKLEDRAWGNKPWSFWGIFMPPRY